jgi:hypothetical protein
MDALVVDKLSDTQNGEPKTPITRTSIKCLQTVFSGILTSVKK